MSQDFRLYGSAGVWDQAMQLGQKNLLRAVADFWPDDVGSALDVGCGDGKLTRLLAADKQVDIVGFDSSAEALSRLPLRKVLGNAASMPFGDQSFDLVLSTDALEHVPDKTHDAVWGELFRVASRRLMVAVPFREELLDATTRCGGCGFTYHVNWHQRSYDLADLCRRAPGGWKVLAVVISGEPWPDMLPAETYLRRNLLGEWSGWSEAICPSCGALGRLPDPISEMPRLAAMALGQSIYGALKKNRQWRSHSEVLVVFGRDGNGVIPVVAEPAQMNLPATAVRPQAQSLMPHLIAYPQVARTVKAIDTGVIIQFPTYEGAERLTVRRKNGAGGSITATIEDGFGVLHSGELLAAGIRETELKLPRKPIPGRYGILLRTGDVDLIDEVSLGLGPIVTWFAPHSPAAVGYHVHARGEYPVYVQIAGETWLDDSFLDTPDSSSEVVGNFLCRIDELADLHAGELRTNLEHGQREIEALRSSLAEARDGRDAFAERANVADRLAVDLQNLQAERDVLRGRVRDADRLAVDVQNLSAERDALLVRAREADKLAVNVQNLLVERDSLLTRAREADSLAVDVQNLMAERQVLAQRAGETARLELDLQSLKAERDALRGSAAAADRLALEVERLAAERDELLQRVEHMSELAREIESLTVEREDLLSRANGKELLAERVKELESENRSLMQQLNDQASQNDSLRSVAAEQAAAIQRLTREAVELGARLEALQKSLAELEGRTECRFGEWVRGRFRELR